jgi:hypothetical protein
MAFKRAKHFSNFDFVGPFSIVRQNGSGPVAAASNYCLMLDANGDGRHAHEDDLWFFHWWAQSINDFCDKNQVANNESAKLGMSCFLSRIWLDPTKLED